MIPKEDDVIPSFLTLNSIDKSSMLYTDEVGQGIVEHFNKFENSTWTLDIHDTFWNEYTIFKTYGKEKKDDQVVEASIATASNYIKLPFGDF